MTQCWEFLPEDRPSFSALVETTENLLMNHSDYLKISDNLAENITYLQPLLSSGKYAFNYVSKVPSRLVSLKLGSTNKVLEKVALESQSRRRSYEYRITFNNYFYDCVLFRDAIVLLNQLFFANFYQCPISISF